MNTGFEREARAVGLPRGPASGALVTDQAPAASPAPAKRYLRFMKVAGRPRDWSFRLAWRGRFRPSRHSRWLPCDAWQYNTSLEIARLFHMRLRLGCAPS